MPSFPNNIRVFEPKVDLQDVVRAAHMNAVQAEVTATQQALGALPQGGFDSVRERIEDVEAGLAAIPTGPDPYPQYYNSPRHNANNHSFVNHNNLSGLTSGDPHPQYLTQARGDARYVRPGDLPDFDDYITEVPEQEQSSVVFGYGIWEAASNNNRSFRSTVRIPPEWESDVAVEIELSVVLQFRPGAGRRWCHLNVGLSNDWSPLAETEPSQTQFLEEGGRVIQTTVMRDVFLTHSSAGSIRYIRGKLDWGPGVSAPHTESKHVVLTAKAFRIFRGGRNQAFATSESS